MNYVAFDEIKWLCGLTKYTSQKFIAKPELCQWVDITRFDLTSRIAVMKNVATDLSLNNVMCVVERRKFYFKHLPKS